MGEESRPDRVAAMHTLLSLGIQTTHSQIVVATKWLAKRGILARASAKERGQPFITASLCGRGRVVGGPRQDPGGAVAAAQRRASGGQSEAAHAQIAPSGGLPDRPEEERVEPSPYFYRRKNNSKNVK